MAGVLVHLGAVADADPEEHGHSHPPDPSVVTGARVDLGGQALTVEASLPLPDNTASSFEPAPPSAPARASPGYQSSSRSRAPPSHHL